MKTKEEFIEEAEQFIAKAMFAGDRDVALIMVKYAEHYHQQKLEEVMSSFEYILETAKCPDCDGTGAIPVSYNNPDGEPQQDWEQCRWCYERSEFIELLKQEK